MLAIEETETELPKQAIPGIQGADVWRVGDSDSVEHILEECHERWGWQHGSDWNGGRDDCDADQGWWNVANYF